MKKADLVSKTAQKAGISKAEAKIVVEALITSVKDALVRREMVKLKGFGTFRVKHRNGRRIKSLQNEEIITIPPTVVPVFKASKYLCDKLNTREIKHERTSSIKERTIKANGKNLRVNGLIVRSRKFFEMFFTSLAWIIIMAFGLWVIASIGWYLLFLLWQKELLIPAAVPMTVIALFYIFLFACIITILLFLWTKFNYLIYHKKNKRNIIPLKLEAPVFDWLEAVIETEKVDYKDLVPGSNLLIIKETKNGLP